MESASLARKHIQLSDANNLVNTSNPNHHAIPQQFPVLH